MRPSALQDDCWAPQLIFLDRSRLSTAKYHGKCSIEPIESISLLVTEWFKKLVETYRAFGDCHRQALWKSTHVLPISSRQRQDDLKLTTFCEKRRHRRSRSGPRWKTVFRFVLQGMIEGHCDLGVLLDPFFLHFPDSSKKRIWYPGSGCKKIKFPNFITALSLADSDDPWRNQYQSAIAKNHGSSITRISRKICFL